MLPRHIFLQYIFAHWETGEKHGAVLACVASIIGAAELTDTIVTNPTMKTALFIANSCISHNKGNDVMQSIAHMFFVSYTHAEKLVGPYREVRELQYSI